MYSCCIDKTSTAELSEAINSMFRWYGKAAVCYAYLSDVKDATQLAESRWFTRGWTLQELVAPRTVWFFNSSWRYFGSKRDLRREIQEITSIDETVLTGLVFVDGLLEDGVLGDVSIARRMSWAAKRQTTRLEDRAYSLLGIFDVNMPLLYGEGEKAFTRLQEAIMKNSDDQSLFAWGLVDTPTTMKQFLDRSDHSGLPMRGMLATSPSEFTNSDCIHVLAEPHTAFPPMIVNSGIRIELQVVKGPYEELSFAILKCTMQENFGHYLGFATYLCEDQWVTRWGELLLIPVADVVASGSGKPYCKPSVLSIKEPVANPRMSTTTNILKLVNIASDYKDHYHLADVYCSAHATYESIRQELVLSKDKNALHAAFCYEPTTTDPLKLFQSADWKEPYSNYCRAVGIERNGDEYNFATRKYQDVKLYNNYKLVWTSFAVLVGDTRGSPWVEIMHILDDNDSDQAFRRLHAANAKFVQLCTTRKHLKSLVKQDTLMEPARKLQKYEISRPVLEWDYSRGDYARGWGAGRMESNQGTLYAKASIQMTFSNLVESSLRLFVCIDRDNDCGSLVKPAWWSYSAQE